MNKYQLKKIISEEEILSKIKLMAKQIEEDYKNEELLCVCILKGAAVFMSELIQHIDSNKLAIDFMSISSYGNDTESSGVVKILKDLDQSVENRNVLIIEDILDTGNTLYQLKDMFEQRNTKSFKICTLLDKPSRRLKNIDADYCGFIIDDLFVVGFGIDYAEKHRNLPYIAEVCFGE